ncbi:MAG TPA: hypothetical protein DDZ39_10655, partial [Flavobacteriaceae bacterium]|nr:hypothetical protein [Flavobacteriaceae bacterium]
MIKYINDSITILKDKVSIKKIAVILFFILGVNLIDAQIDNSDFRVTLAPESLGVCNVNNNSNEIVTIKAKKNNSLHNFNIEFTLPSGVEYVPGTVAITQNPGAYAITYVNTSTVTNPEFEIRNLAGGATDENWSLGDEFIFTFQRTADCPAVNFKESGGAFKDRHQINYLKNNQSKSAQDINDSVSSYELLSASLSVLDIDPINGLVSNVTSAVYFTRPVEVVQGGNGNIQLYHHEVFVDASIHNYQLLFNGSVLTPASSSLDVITNVTTMVYDIDLTQAPFNVATANEDGDQQFENSEKFIFEERFAIINCDNVNIFHDVYWGCGGAECQKSGIKSGAILLGNQLPALQLTQLEGSNDICATNHFRVRIENTGTDAGSSGMDVYINIGLGHNQSPLTSYNTNPFWAYDWRDTREVNNIHFTNGPAVIPTFNNLSTLYPGRGSGNTIAIPPNFLVADPDGPGVGLEDLDGDGFYDDLAPGESTIIELDIDYNPRSNCGTGLYDYITWEHLYFDVNIKNQCLEPKDAKRLDLGYRNIIRDYLRTTELGGDKDVSDGDSFELTITPAMYSNINLNGHNALSANADSEFSVSINVPDGVTIDAANANAGLFTQVANTITYTTTNLHNYPLVLANVFQGGVLKFPLAFDCTTYIANNASNVFTVGYTTNLKLKDSNGVICFNEDIHCGSFESVTTHGCFPACSGPTITEFETFRTSAGWTDNTQNTKVDLSQAVANGYKLQNYLVGDTMRINTKAVINNYTTDNMFFEIKYSTVGNTLGANTIEYLDGTINVYDSSTGTTTAVQALTSVPVVASSGSNHTATFDISSYKNLFDNDFDSSDSIYVSLNYRFNLNQTSYNLHKLTNFRGEFYALDNANVKVSCDTYGSAASVLRVRKGFGANVYRFKNCEEGVLRIYSTERSNAGDLFPYEYRPPFGLENVTAILPQGFTFTGRAEILNNQGNFTVANNGITFSQVGNAITLTPTANFRNGDQTNTYYPRASFWVKGTCTADEDGLVTYQANFKDYHYGANTVEPTKNASRALDYTKPTFTLQPASSAIVNGDNTVADFDLNITNTSFGPGSIDYNWIRVSPNPNITVISAFDITSGGSIPLNIVQSGGETWVEIGSLTNNTSKEIRIKANYTSCTNQVLTFSHGWNCDAYPTQVEYGNLTNQCYENSTQLTLSPRSSEVQLTITDQPSARIDMCDTFHIKLQINSAQLARLLNPRVEFTIPGGISSLDIISINIKYPYNAATTENAVYTTVGNILNIDLLSHSVIAGLGGIPGTNDALTVADRQVELDFELKTTCDYISGTPLLFKVFANKPCGDTAEGNGSLVYSNDININGVVQPYDAFSAIVLPNELDVDGAHIDGCSVTETVNITTIFSDIAGQSATQTDVNDFGRVTIPTNVSYVNGTFTSPNGITLVSSNANELVIQYPAGLTNLQSADFSFDIQTGISGCATDADFTIINYIETGGLNCGASSCVNAIVTTGSSTELLDVMKPSVIDNGGSTASITSFNANNNYSFTINLANNGLDAPSGYTYDIYCADNAGNPTGASMYSGAIQAIAAGGTLTENINFTSNTICSIADGMVFVMNPSASQCMCDVLQLNLPLNAVAVDAIDDAFSTNEDTPVSGDIFNDNGSGQDILGVTPTTVTANTNPAHGTLTINANGTFTYTPDLGYSGIDSFTYTITDSFGQTDTATVIISIVSTLDTDDDGIVDAIDLDDDNDGILDTDEG